MLLRQFFGEKQACGFNHHVGIDFVPFQVGGVALGGEADFLAVNDQIVAIYGDIAFEAAVYAVVAQHIGQIVGFEQIVDADDFNVIGKVLHCRTKYAAANATKTVNTYLDCHVDSPEVNKKPKKCFQPNRYLSALLPDVRLHMVSAVLKVVFKQGVDVHIVVFVVPKCNRAHAPFALKAQLASQADGGRVVLVNQGFYAIKRRLLLKAPIQNAFECFLHIALPPGVARELIAERASVPNSRVVDKAAASQILPVSTALQRPAQAAAMPRSRIGKHPAQRFVRCAACGVQGAVVANERARICQRGNGVAAIPAHGIYVLVHVPNGCCVRAAQRAQ